MNKTYTESFRNAIGIGEAIKRGGSFIKGEVRGGGANQPTITPLIKDPPNEGHL